MLSADERAIRDLITNWEKATATGDLHSLLDMMSEDVVFLAPGQQPLRGKETFADTFRTAWEHLRIDARSEVQEIRISNGLAYCWNHYSVTITSLVGEPPRRRKGYTLTILRKNRDGDWLIARDANMLSSDPS